MVLPGRLCVLGCRCEVIVDCTARDSMERAGGDVPAREQAFWGTPKQSMLSLGNSAAQGRTPLVLWYRIFTQECPQEDVMLAKTCYETNTGGHSICTVNADCLASPVRNVVRCRQLAGQIRCSTRITTLPAIPANPFPSRLLRCRP